jgi:murein DD-endopeptidase MepM/ murein hydrolase activator NlpD
VADVDASQLTDTFTQSRSAGRPHEAIDIMAPRGTPVIAVADGKVAKIFESKPGGHTVYQFDVEEKLAYYYAHLDGYAPGLAEGQRLKRGELIGFVGSSGNADAAHPHLHFAVFELGPEKRWWEGRAINPYPLLGGKENARQ